jgi:hypothetical protein
MRSLRCQSRSQQSAASIPRFSLDIRYLKLEILPRLWRKTSLMFNNQNRMTTELSKFAAHLREFIHSSSHVGDDVRSHTSKPAFQNEPPHVGSRNNGFDALALELFALQFTHNAPYRRFCQARGGSPETVTDWRAIPAIPTVAFKELELLCLPVGERTAVFHSSGTTGHVPGRHFHNAESLAIYEESAWQWFRANVAPDFQSGAQSPRTVEQPATGNTGPSRVPAQSRSWQMAMLTPPPAQAPHSSLVHMFETVRREWRSASSQFFGCTDTVCAWHLNFEAVSSALREACDTDCPVVLLGTAFSFVHLLDWMGEKGLQFDLPEGSRAMETGGYKGKSRSLSKAELHALITWRLGIPPARIVCEYGMSELSSQAYDRSVGSSNSAPPASRSFRFPPWARVQIVSPETGREVAEGETGLIRVLDLANVFSVMAIQTEDLGVRRGDGFELLGRAVLAEPRGCSLMAQSANT